MSEGLLESESAPGGGAWATGKALPGAELLCESEFKDSGSDDAIN